MHPVSGIYTGLCNSCYDLVRNGDEVDVDCDGSCDDCPTCLDDEQNGDETGVDCGGSCGLPLNLKDKPAGCVDKADNGACGTGGQPPCCIRSECDAGCHNGDETGIDCGGSCGNSCF